MGSTRPFSRPVWTCADHGYPSIYNTIDDFGNMFVELTRQHGSDSKVWPMWELEWARLRSTMADCVLTKTTFVPSNTMKRAQWLYASKQLKMSFELLGGGLLIPLLILLRLNHDASKSRERGKKKGHQSEASCQNNSGNMHLQTMQRKWLHQRRAR